MELENPTQRKTVWGELKKAPVKSVLYLASGILLVLMMIAAFTSPAGAWPLMVAALGCLMIANLDRFAEFSASSGGISMRMKQTEERINQLTRDVAFLSAKSSMGLVQRSGWLGTFTDEEKRSFLDDALKLLKDAGATDDQVSEIRQNYWDKYVWHDYVQAILGSNIPSGATPEIEQRWRDLRRFGPHASSSDIEQFLREIGCFEGDKREFTKAYGFYREHNYHQDMALWTKRNEIHSQRLIVVPK